MGICIPATDCNLNASCTNCDQGYYLKNGKCIYSEFCASYENGQCTSCSNTNTIVNEKCVNKSRCKTFANDGTCTSCSSSAILVDGECRNIDGCSKVSGGLCTKCYDAYILDEENNACVAKNHCNAWNEDGKCTSCDKNYLLKDGMCNYFKGCINSIEDGKCSSCSSGYSLVNGICEEGE